jgi:hypothetical protein
MSMYKATLVAVALATAAAAWTTPSIAAPNEQSMAEGSILMISPGGKYVMGKMTDKSMGMVRHAKPVAAGTIIFMHNGKLYMMSDPKGMMWGHMSDYVGTF